MNILFDIGHPAHAHFFKFPIQNLRAHGHKITVTSRVKEFTLDLLNELDIQHIPLSRLRKGGLFSLAMELITRDIALLKIVKQYNIDVMAAIGGVSIAHITRLKRIPSLVFYDTENATLQNLITYPFATQIIVPRCYRGWLPKTRNIRYSGYHELSYLHPNVFTPDRQKAIQNGLAKDEDTFFVRTVSWRASHDIGENGWSRNLLENIVNKLSTMGKVIISSESPLTGNLAKYCYQGQLSEVHHVLAFSKVYIGESATMASECAVLGVPAIYAAETGRGYTEEQESVYGLVKNIKKFDWNLLNSVIDNILKIPVLEWKMAHKNLLDNTIDVTEFVTNLIENYPDIPLNRKTVLNL